MGEVWKDIPGWEGYYQASTLGRIRSVDRHVLNRGDLHFLKGVILRDAPCGKTGHRGVVLCRDSEPKTLRVHQLVMWTFRGHQAEGIDVCHNNGNPEGNRLSNLRYGTRADNFADKRIHGTDFNANKTQCPRGHVLVGPNLTKAALKKGSRDCRSCGNARAYIRHNNIPMEQLQEYADKYFEKYTKENA